MAASKVSPPIAMSAFDSVLSLFYDNGIWLSSAQKSAALQTLLQLSYFKKITLSDYIQTIKSAAGLIKNEELDAILHFQLLLKKEGEQNTLGALLATAITQMRFVLDSPQYILLDTSKSKDSERLRLLALLQFFAVGKIYPEKSKTKNTSKQRWFYEINSNSLLNFSDKKKYHSIHDALQFYLLQQLTTATTFSAIASVFSYYKKFGCLFPENIFIQQLEKLPVFFNELVLFFSTNPPNQLSKKLVDTIFFRLYQTHLFSTKIESHISAIYRLSYIFRQSNSNQFFDFLNEYIAVASATDAGLCYALLPDKSNFSLAAFFSKNADYQIIAFLQGIAYSENAIFLEEDFLKVFNQWLAGLSEETFFRYIFSLREIIKKYNSSAIEKAIAPILR